MADSKVKMAGATHVNKATGEAVKATAWNKDGDHPKVERYPIDGRIYKGLLTLNRKSKHALRFGDVIVEDQKGRVVIKSPEDFKDGFTPLEGAK